MKDLLLGLLCRLNRANEVHHHWELTQHQGIRVLEKRMTKKRTMTMVDWLSWRERINDADNVAKFTFSLGGVRFDKQKHKKSTFPLGAGSGWSFLERRSSMMSSGTMPWIKIWKDNFVELLILLPAPLILANSISSCASLIKPATTTPVAARH